MPAQNLPKLIKNEEDTVASKVEKLFYIALSNKGVLSKVDKLTTSCSTSKTPPKEIVKAFEKTLATASKNLKSYYPAANIKASLTYNQKSGKWRATPKVVCGTKLKPFGGGTYTVKAGDTLWDIARVVYGTGGLWTEIAAANKKAVTSRGNFILAGVTLKLPKLSLPVGQCGIDMLSPNLSAPKVALKSAKNVCLPPFSLDFNATKPTVRIIKGPIVAWKVTTRLTGSLSAVCDLLLTSGVTIKSAGAEVEKAAFGFVAGIEVNSVSGNQIKLGAKSGGMTLGIKLSPSRPGEFTGFASGQNVTIKTGRTVLSGKIGVEVTIQAMPRVRVQDLKGQMHELWVDHGELIKGIGLVGGAIVVGLAATALIATPVPGDEVIAYATAARMMASGLQLVR